MQKTHAADDSTSAKGFEATSTGCGTTNSDAMNNCGTVITRKSMGKVLGYGMVLFAFLGLSLGAKAQISVWDGTSTTWTNGTGTQSDPYLIENAKQLAYLAFYVSNANPSAGKYWKLTTDIDLNSLQWTPIGGTVSFSGNFDGNTHTIANLVVNINGNGSIYAGLFGQMNGGSVKNIGIIDNSIIIGGYNVGGIVGYAEGNVTINNCYNTGSISSSNAYNSYAGGIVGYARNVTINNCYNIGSVSSSNAYNSYAGGIVGYNNYVTINNCYSTGNISSSNTTYAGGIVGYLQNGNVNNSYYLNTSAPNPGGGIPKTEVSMKSSAFVYLLNNGPIPNFAYKFDYFLVNGGYPIHSDFKLQTLSPTNLTRNTATLNGIIDFGNAIVMQQGFILDSNGMMDTVYGSILNNDVSYTISGLAANATYQYKVFAISDSNMYCGEYVSFTTLPFNQNGTAFLIEDRDDLIMLANFVNGGNSFNGQEFILANDIVLSNTPNNILSIGTKATNRPFSGIFNGNSKRIYNVYIDNPNTPYQGLFGYTKNAHIKELGLVNITASGREYTGGMVGYAENTRLDYSYVSGGTLFALSYCGGLVGYQTQGTNSIITSCYNTCTVTGNNYVGGLLGYSYEGTVRNSYVAALVTGQGKGVGAIIGGAQDVLFYNWAFNDSITGQTVAIGENKFKAGEEGDMTSKEMRLQSFVNTLNQGLVTPMWKMDYNPPINNGFPILIWQTSNPPVNVVETHCNASLRVYPNPTTGQLTIECRDVINHVSTVEIYNVVGQNVGAGFNPAPTNAKNGITIDISHLSAGMYFLKIGNNTARFVKE